MKKTLELHTIRFSNAINQELQIQSQIKGPIPISFCEAQPHKHWNKHQKGFQTPLLFFLSLPIIFCSSRN